MVGLWRLKSRLDYRNGQRANVDVGDADIGYENLQSPLGKRAPIMIFE